MEEVWNLAELEIRKEFRLEKVSVVQARVIKKMDIKMLKVCSEKLAREWKVHTGSYRK